jgi:hypothetical protein
MNLLKRATPEKLRSDTRKILDEVVDSCRACQIYAGSPMHFTIRTPEEVVFKQELRLDLMFLDERKPVLHVVDAGMTFQAAAFLASEDSNSVWSASVTDGATSYVGIRHRYSVTRAASFSPIHLRRCARFQRYTTAAIHTFL